MYAKKEKGTGRVKLNRTIAMHSFLIQVTKFELNTGPTHRSNNLSY